MPVINVIAMRKTLQQQLERCSYFLLDCGYCDMFFCQSAPIKIDIGAVFNARPSEHKSLPAPIVPVESI